MRQGLDSFVYIQEQDKQMFYDFLKSQSKIVNTKEEKHFLSEARISHFYGCKVLMLYDAYKALTEFRMDPVGFIAYKCGKDGYLSIYFIYTAPKYRGQGNQKKIIDYVLQHENPKRIYSLASTLDSVMFYHKLGYTFWGYTKKHELVVDYDISASRTEPTKATKVLKKNDFNIGCKYSQKMIEDFIIEFYEYKF